MENGFVAKAEAVINVPVEKVWSVLVDPAMIKKWLFGTEAVSDWKVGSSITYKGNWNGMKYEDKGTILELVPNELLVSTYWSSMSGTPDSPENYATVSYKLTSLDDGTKLEITQDNNPSEESANHSKNNWELVLKTLKELLEEKGV